MEFRSKPRVRTVWPVTSFGANDQVAEEGPKVTWSYNNGCWPSKKMVYIQLKAPKRA